MSIDPDLMRLLKRLKLGPLAPTLPERLTLARAQQLDYAAFLTLLLADEVQRRDQLALERHLTAAGFEELATLEAFDWSSPIQVDKRQLQAVFSLQFLAQKEHVLFVGPVGVGKTFLAQALGTAAVRAGHSVVFIRADNLLRELNQARADHTLEKAFRRSWRQSFWSSMTLACTVSLPSRAATSMTSSSSATVAAVSSSPRTAASTSGWACSMTRSSVTPHSIAWHTALTKSSSKDQAIGPSSHPRTGRRAPSFTLLQPGSRVA
ncbi:MAG TPA: ATP-binding protein [Chloroflexota bacterium]|nr:ATP-binding protein [Chloroflexota bacterium]